MPADFSAAIADDWQVLDGRETVTYAAAAGTPAPFAVAGAVRYALGLPEVEASGGFYENGDVVFELPVSQLPAAPRRDDTITETSGKVYTVVQKVGRIVWDTAWQLVCRPQR